MTHYEQRMAGDLAGIREQVAAVAAKVDEAVHACADALIRQDRAAAARIILGDLPINRAIREIDRVCHVFVARHLPSAGHLRFISSVLRLTVALERVGDYAVTIARETVQLSKPVPTVVARDIELMAEHARSMLSQAMKAFHDGNAELARGTKGMATQTKNTFAKVFSDLLKEGDRDTHPLKDLFALLIVFNRLERISDQAKNICEEAIFAATGETKPPKVYRVLFLDEHNDFLSILAEAIANKTFPESGKYSSAGWNPASTLRLPLVEFLDSHGLAAGNTTPQPLPGMHDLNEFHVIVSLGGDARPHLEEVPFHTALLEWDVEKPDTPELSAAVLQPVYKQIAHQVRELMVLLRGEQAA